ncbi:MAG: NAD-dependent epimerase/dehydratase family protein [Deltaproteobacteria bacterium]|nr:NAD-dependent epimerase/dehydratase family protein [Deltaproteobacteria bacterium]
MAIQGTPVIAITSVGSGVGQSIVESCRLSGLTVRLVGLGANPFAFGGFDCDVRELLPTIYAADYPDVLLEKCLEHGVDLLIPGLDDELLTLSGNLGRFRERGIEVVVSGPELLRLCRDKERMSRDLNRIAPVFVETMNPERMKELYAAGRLRFPLIAKPRSGFASRGLIVVNGREDFARVSPNHVVQTLAVPCRGDIQRETFLEGLKRGEVLQIGELSAQVVVGKNGRELGRMITRNKLVNGVPIEVIPVDGAEAWAEIDRLMPHFLALGLRGPLNIQGRLTDEGIRFFEMNARFTGITGLRAMIGFNEVAAVIRDALGNLPGHFTLRHNPRRIGLRQVCDRAVDVDLDRHLAAAVRSAGCRGEKAAGRRILVTGANSYLGRAVLGALLETEGLGEIAALVRNPGRFAPGGEPPLPAGVAVHDLNELWSGSLSLGHFDILIHLASGRPVHAAEVLSDSLRYSRDLMALAAKHHLPGLILASSQAVYGLSRPPLWHEGMSPIPESPYGQAKWASELMAAMVRQINNVTAVTSLRLAQLIGWSDGIRFSELPHLFPQKAVAGEPITVAGGEQLLDYVHVRDAARLLASLCLRPFADWPEVVNAGSGAPIRLAAFADLIDRLSRQLLGRNAEVKFNPAAQRLELGMSIERAGAVLGWQPEISLEEGIAEIMTQLLRGKEADRGRMPPPPGGAEAIAPGSWNPAVTGPEP